MIKRLSFILSLVFTINLQGQDTTSILGFYDFMKLVKTEHPISYQANLLQDLADGRQRMAKGGFDPKLEGDWSQKSFDDKNYYSIFSGTVKVPTWFGIELKAGYENNQGVFLNESDKIPQSGLWHAGISVPVGRGFILDQRRAELQKAELFQKATVQEQIILLNELYYQAANAYILWQINQGYLNIAEEGVVLALNKFEGSRKSFEQGDKPAIDTLESFIAIQARQQMRLQANQELQNSRIALNNFLWSKGTTPLELTDGTQPESFSIALLNDPVEQFFPKQNQLISNHPELLKYSIKVEDLNVDLKLQSEDIKPDIRLAYNPIVNTENRFVDNFDIGNYKLGATASYPILQRKARGKVQMTEVKIKETEFDFERKQQSLKVKLDTYRNNLDNIQEQVVLLERTLENYQQMLNAENRKFFAGESSIFLVNSREQKYLDGAYKVLSTNFKLIKNRITYLYSLGQLPQIF